MKSFILICALVLSGLSAGIASAATVEEIAEMGRKGVAESEMLQAVTGTTTTFDMNAGEVLKLRDAKVPESVIAAMLTHTPGGSVAAAANAPKPAAPSVPAPAPQANGDKRIASVADIVAMAKSGANEAQMLTAIDDSGAIYPVGTTELIQLKQGGVSDKVIAEAMAHQSHHSTVAFATTPTIKQSGIMIPPPQAPEVAQPEPNAPPATNGMIISVDDVIALSNARTPEADLIKKVDASGARYTIGANEIVKLTEAHVSQAVIAEMIRHQGRHSENVNAAPTAPPARVAGENARPQRQNLPAGGPGKITIDNLDNQDWSYFYEPGVQTLWLTNPANDGRGVVHAHSSVTISMEEGLYQVRMLGSKIDGMAISVYSNDRSTIGLNRVNAGGREVLQATVFEKGERKGTATLTELLPPETATAETPPATTTVYTESPAYYYYGVPYYSYGPRYYSRPYFGGGYRSGGGGGVGIGIGIGIGGGHHH